MNSVMQATNGIFKTEYAFHTITVRLFEAPELMDQDKGSVFQAVVTYSKDGEQPRQELDTLSSEQRDHCRNRALELEEADGSKPFGDKFKGYMAQAYWSLIQ